MEVGGSSLREPQWYAVQTKPRQEERVRRWLEERTRLPVFLPKLEQVRRRRARRVSVIEPLFPSYLFVHMALDPEPWYAVKWTPGVRQVVGTGGQPQPVPGEAMALLLERCGEQGLVAWRPPLRAGEAVRVLHGPFAGLEGILERPTSRGERVRVLLALLGGTTPVELDVTDIEIVA
ncbi:MAG: transcription termination/antitermination protein NusG [Armatimonadota bacterium]|nr:transcription termination/antitermination protein NusG [Armatimonadota bacterium]MDR7453269.1 transcription termination/antitermination protein NusG [Armatimonadota bacterium]MDR7457389.1 transcription termination/antitermination protein NusG [Armatimonadota bacterium]MDR7497513.1 transcription termination/antitermination protein NusG [Armatimonadota bacterium]MDR7511009.1 transcription termination/antitermination protein NusG [Armatimonadota bacterium]